LKFILRINSRSGGKESLLWREGTAPPSYCLLDQLRFILRIWLKIRREGGRVVEERQSASRLLPPRTAEVHPEDSSQEGMDGDGVLEEGQGTF
jgi:hypothetical protein